MNWKVIILGGLAYFVATFAVGMITGMYIHNGVLKEVYDATASFWQPALNQDPPDMAAIMPLWITTGLITSFIFAGIYDAIRSAFAGSAVMKGLKFGLVLFLFMATWSLSMSGVFNLPQTIWTWWIIESLIYALVGGAALGWAVGKFASD